MEKAKEIKSWKTNLSGANLSRADLSGANLAKTCLDPNNKPNSYTKGFKKSGEYIVGYRTRKAGHIDQYKDGRIYSADWFSTSDTECHPGLYLWPTLQYAMNFSGKDTELIKVRTKPSEVHHAGMKWRCRWFEVLGGAK